MSSKKSFKSVFSLSLAGLVFWLAAATALASGNVSVTRANPDPFSENKSWFFFGYVSGEAIEDAVSVKNFGKQDVTVQVYGMDAINNESGSFILKFPQDEQKGIGKWTRVKSSAIELKPGESKEVPFSINPPEDLEPGEYFGGIVVQESAQNEEEKSSDSESLIGAAVTTRVASRIYLTVPGEVNVDFSWKSFEHFFGDSADKRYFKFALDNSGNVSLVPKVTLRYFNMFDREVASSEHDLGTSLPGSTIEPVILWEDVPFWGKYTVRAELTYAGQDAGQKEKVNPVQLTKQVVVWIVPWVHLSLLVFALIALLAFVLLRAQRLARLKQNATDYEVKAGDNIKDLAKIAGVSWRMLAKMNDLEPPYVLEEGQHIRVPIKK